VPEAHRLVGLFSGLRVGVPVMVEEKPAAGAPAQRAVVLVTGGSRGIGLALAHEFAARGHDLILVARDRQRLQRATGTIAAAHGVSVEHIACDLAAPDAVSRLIGTVGAAGCYVDILVNCAGIGSSGTFTGDHPRRIGPTLHLNIDASTALMQACLPGMVARRRGGVLNVSSLAGMLPMPHLALYGATKSYLVALSRAVAWEVSGSGVTVSVLLPGPVDTDFFAHEQQADEHRVGLLPGLSPEAVARIGIEGHVAGQTVITPGMGGWLCRLGLKLLPRRMPAALVRSIMRSALARSTATASRASRIQTTPKQSIAEGSRRLRRAIAGRSISWHWHSSRRLSACRSVRHAMRRTWIFARSSWQRSCWSRECSFWTCPILCPDAAWRPAIQPSSPESPR
jgi:short-subunit dehydrogenase